MTKHIIGLLLFSLIVGTSAGVAGFFNTAPERVKSFTIKGDYAVYKRRKRRRRCRRRRPRSAEAAALKISNAMFNMETGILTVLPVKRYEDGKESRSVIYHFFSKDQFGARRVRSERVWIKQNSSFNSSYIRKRFGWLARPISRENLYLIVESSNSLNWREAPKFDERAAVPIIVTGPGLIRQSIR